MAVEEETFVGFATVLEGVAPFQNKNVNSTYKGQILTESGVKFALIKDIAPKECANELLVFALAKLAKIPVPNAYLAKWPDTIPIKLTKSDIIPGGGRLAFASEFMSTPAMGSFYNGSNPATIKKIIERLTNWPHLHLLYAIDALAANIDRHLNNILFDGRSDAWLIDHGHCLSGPNWTPADLHCDKDYQSKIMGWLSPEIQEGKRQKLASDACILETTLQNHDIKSICKNNRISDLISSSDNDSLVSFIQDRIKFIPKLTATTLLLGRLT